MKLSDDAKTMLRADLDNENETIRNYRERVRECEALGEYAMAEDIREILRQEQEHQIDLATALGIDVPDVEQDEGARQSATLTGGIGPSGIGIRVSCTAYFLACSMRATRIFSYAPSKSA